MKMREEIDALRTMVRSGRGADRAARARAVIALPILAFFGSMAALYGGGLVAWLYGGMSPEIYLARSRGDFGDAFSGRHDQGAIHGTVIGVVACSEGCASRQRRIAGNADTSRWSIDLPGHRARRRVRHFLCLDRNVTDGFLEQPMAIRVGDLVVGFGNQVVLDHFP